MIGKIILLLVVLNAEHVMGQIGMGPLNVDLVSIKPCDGDTGILKIDLVQVGDKKGFTVDLNLPYEMDETISYEARVDKVQNGQIQQGVFRHGGANACKDFDKFLGKLWKNIATAGGLPEGCPKPPGQYHVDDFPFDEKDLDIKTFLYGRFLLNVIVKKSGETQVCGVIEFTNSRPGESV